ncbi:MAG: cation:H+ antiporter [Candidatus Latescibacterota bacterium]|jgi:cation:H+ antiporter
MYLLLLGGLLVLIVGADLMVRGSVKLAAAAGVSGLTIGLTVVAFGTSAPELAVSVRAALSGQVGIAVGNVVGSNIFNLLGVLGLAGAIAPIEISQQTLWVDLPIMLAVTVVCLPVFFTGRIIARWEGVLFLGYYVGYTAFLVLAATGASVDVLQVSIVVVSLTLLTLGISFLGNASEDWPESDSRRRRRVPNAADEDFFYHWPSDF